MEHDAHLEIHGGWRTSPVEDKQAVPASTDTKRKMTTRKLLRSGPELGLAGYLVLDTELLTGSRGTSKYATGCVGEVLGTVYRPEVNECKTLEIPLEHYCLTSVTWKDPVRMWPVTPGPDAVP